MINKEIKKIKERNKGVEADKAWEISKTRRLIISIMTYIVIAIFLWFIKVPRPWINAIIPTLGFILSTLTLSLFKTLWLKYIYKK